MIPFIWIVEGEEALGVFGEAQARMEQAEADLGAMLASWGGAIVGGVAYFFSGSSQQNPPGGWRPDFAPVCTPTSGPGGYEDDNDEDGYAVDFNWEGSYGGDGGDDGPPEDF